jgi:hypothetical protein
LIKLEFKEYNEASWQDWTLYLIDYSDINKLIESELDADVGIIVFDSVSLTMKLESPVTDYFNEVYLTASKKLMFRISKVKKLSNDYVRMFEGIVDLESIEFDEDFPYVSFDVLDKLSYLSKIEDLRIKNITDTLSNRVDLNGDYRIAIFEDVPGQLIIEIQSILTPDTWDTPPDGALLPGEVLAFNDGGTVKYILIKGFGLEDETIDNPPYYYTRARIYGLYSFTGTLYLTTTSLSDIYEVNIYGQNIYNYLSTQISSYNPIKLIKALIEQIYPNTGVVDKTSGSLQIPLNYYNQLIDFSPFGENPLDALKFLADTLLLYIYFDKFGRLVIAQKTALTAGTSRTIYPEYISKIDKKFFWKTPADAIELTAKSFLIDGAGDYIEVTVNFQANPDLKPKNVIKKTIICNDTSVATEQNLIDWAEIQAEAYLDFYKVKRSSILYTLTLNDDTINWDLLDRISSTYFFSAINFDLKNNTVELEAVQIEGDVW